MRNFTSSVIIAVSFLLFSFGSSAKESDASHKFKEFDNVSASNRCLFKTAVDAAAISQFYKKYPNLKKYQNDVLDLYKKKEYKMKFEYVTVPLLTHATKQILDTWGSEGWELVQVVPAPGGGDQLVAYMKRVIA